MADIKAQLRRTLTPDLLLAVHRCKYPYGKGQLPSGAVIGRNHFSLSYGEAFYDLVYHRVLIPMSEMPLETLLAVDMTEYLPKPNATDYPEQSLGLITLLDQSRGLTAGYSFRYTRSFFDAVCEKLARQLVSLPLDVRPDGKNAWLSRGYSVDDWLARTLWFWAPLVHSDEFMVEDRQTVKDWLHSMRSEVEAHSGVPDPYAPLEAADDADLNAFKEIETAGPPQIGHADPKDEATISDYSFWWIRIMNSHFAITDMCGHYPYWIRWKGFEWTWEDKEFMRQTNNFRYDPGTELILQEVRRDSLEGVWKAMEPNPKYEKSQHDGDKNSNTIKTAASTSLSRAAAVGPDVVPPQGSSMMAQ